jgi:hypothetical protein
MASVRVNTYIDSPFGRVQIYTDPEAQAKAERLLRETPKLLTKAYVDAAERYGKEILKMAKRCVETSTPPKGTQWPLLGKRYAERKADYPRTQWYYDGACYLENIGIWKERIVYPSNFSGIRTGNRVYIGLPTGKHHDMAGMASRSNSGPPLTLQKIGKILEQGSRDGTIKPRPLWKPLYDLYGKKDIKVLVKNAIIRQIKQYM